MGWEMYGLRTQPETGVSTNTNISERPGHDSTVRIPQGADTPPPTG